ncbi:MAG: hypothetical protein SVV67_05490 [Bacillota bacterium]|nr:hypothetical protein [Bacillota bacterium]
MESKIRISFGKFEVEYEGSEEYLKTEFIKMVESLIAVVPEEELIFEDEGEEILPESKDPEKKKLELSPNNIAAKINVKTGQDLIMAACVSLLYVKGANKFKRNDILAEMKLANSYYKNTYSNNLTKYLNQLVKNGNLIETKKGEYTLPAEKRKEFDQTFEL